MKMKKKTAKIRNECNQIPHLFQDTTWESDNNTIKHHKQEPRAMILWKPNFLDQIVSYALIKVQSILCTLDIVLLCKLTILKKEIFIVFSSDGERINLNFRIAIAQYHLQGFVKMHIFLFPTVQHVITRLI